MEGGVNYYRAEVPSRHLPGRIAPLDTIVQGKEWVESRNADGELSVRLVRQKGPCAIWMFSGNNTRALLMSEQQNNGIRVLMEVDDNYQVEPPNAHVSEWRMKYDGTDEPSFELHSRIATWVDGMIVATPQLAKEYAPLNQNIYVCPNSIDVADWEEPKKHPYMNDNLQRRKIRVGWAASDSHWRDIQLVARAFEKLDKRGDCEIWIYGIQPDLFKWYDFHFNYVPWADDLATYRRNLQLLDIAVCPLREGVWEDCKSDVKALEATMAGAAVVVSKTEPYRPWWDNSCLVAGSGLNGFIEPLEYLLDNKAEIRRLAAGAKDYILRERTIERSIDKWREAVCGSSSPATAA